MDLLTSPNPNEDFRCRSIFLIGIGFSVWAAIGGSIAHVIWQNRELYGAHRLWLMSLLYAVFCPIFLYAGWYAFRSVHAQLTQNVKPVLVSWMYWGLLQYALLLLFASVYVDQRSYDDIVVILLTLLSPQLVVYVRFWGALLVAFLADIPFVLLVAHQSPVALGLVLLLLHTLIIGFVEESIKAQKSTLDLIEANHKLRVAQLQLANSAKESERLRIARDLHDKVGHHLVALNIQLEVASLMATDDVKAEVNKSQQISKALLQDVRGVVNEMRHHPQPSADQRIAALIENTRLVVPHIDIRFLNDTTDFALEPAFADILVLSTQELLTNALKHGTPTEITVELAMTERHLTVRVTDDGQVGKGVSLVSSTPQWGNGLTGILERLSVIKGSLITAYHAHGFEAIIKVGTSPRTEGEVA